jgi:hypothetical protein
MRKNARPNLSDLGKKRGTIRKAGRQEQEGVGFSCLPAFLRAYALKLARVPKQFGIGGRCSVENRNGGHVKCEPLKKR